MVKISTDAEKLKLIDIMETIIENPSLIKN